MTTCLFLPQTVIYCNHDYMLVSPQTVIYCNHDYMLVSTPDREIYCNHDYMLVSTPDREIYCNHDYMLVSPPDRETVIKKFAVGLLQVNIGIYCNQACSHCHVESSPKRKEMMSREVADKCLDILEKSPSIHTVDITGTNTVDRGHYWYDIHTVDITGTNTVDRGHYRYDIHTVDITGTYLPTFLEHNVVDLMK
jgi:hypothetical protein